MRRMMMHSSMMLIASLLTFVTEAADRATPKAALETLARAAANGSAEEYLQSFDFKADEERLKRALERTLKASAKLKEAVKTKFGEGQSKIPALPIGLPERLVAQATVSIRGDDATVDVGKVQPISLRRIKNEWHTSIEGFFHVPVGNLEPMVKRLADSLEVTARGVAAGNFKSAQDAYNTINRVPQKNAH